MDTSFDLQTALRTARHRAWIVLASIVVGLASSYVVTGLIAPTYEATSTLFVGHGDGSTASGLQESPLAQSLAPSYAALAGTMSVEAAAAQRIRLPVGKIVGHVSARTQPGLQIIWLQARARSAALAARIANAVAGALSERVASLNGGGRAAIGVSAVDPARQPAQPVSPNRSLGLVFGGLAGLLSGIGLALLRERLDRRIYTPSQAEREVGLPILAVLPALPDDVDDQDAQSRHRDDAIAEPYRSLATRIGQNGSRDETAKRILVTSTVADDDKTRVVAHVALALAEQGAGVALVEGDLRRPKLWRHFPVSGRTSLEDVLAAEQTPRLRAFGSLGCGLTVLAAVYEHNDASRILRSREFARVVEAATQAHEHVLVDAPPALASSDASVLARHADVALVVVRAGVTRASDVRTVKTTFRELGVEVNGILLEGARFPVRRRLRRLLAARPVTPGSVKEPRERVAAPPQQLQPEPDAPSAATNGRAAADPEPVETKARFGWKIETLARLVEQNAAAYPERSDEWRFTLFYLRSEAEIDGTLPKRFDSIVADSFGDLLAAR